MKIYTRTGDDGSTTLYSGGRVSKSALRVEAYGTVDELNAHLGVVRAHKAAQETRTRVETVQNHLFRMGADLATPLDSRPDWLVRVDEENVAWLEEDIDTMTEQLDPLKNFVLPGGSLAAAHLHVARTVCRRAERLVVALAEQEPVNEQARYYLNRLSDWLFVLSRLENKAAGIAEEKWVVDRDA